MSDELTPGEVFSDANPYRPPPSGDQRDGYGWIATLWDITILVFLGILIYETVTVVLWHLSQFPDAPTQRDVLVLIARFVHIARGTLFFGLVATSLSSLFFKRRGRWWRALFIAEAILILIDPMMLRPTLQSLVESMLFLVLTLPVFFRGYGWIGAAIELTKRIKQRWAGRNKTPGSVSKRG